MARNKGSQTDVAYNYIKERILKFEYMPGEELNAMKLEQILGMSRSPLYEAFLHLIADGLVEKKGSKSIVSPISRLDIIEICQVRVSIELSAIEILFENGGPDEGLLSELALLLDQMKSETNQLMEQYQYDDRFHSLLMYATKNSRMIDIVDRMRLQISRARWLNVLTPNRLNEANKEHEALYLALKEKDLQKSLDAMNEHLKNTKKNFEVVLDMLNLNPQMFLGITSFVDIKNDAV